MYIYTERRGTRRLNFIINRRRQFVNEYYKNACKYLGLSCGYTKIIMLHIIQILYTFLLVYMQISDRVGTGWLLKKKRERTKLILTCTKIV